MRSHSEKPPTVEMNDSDISENSEYGSYNVHESSIADILDLQPRVRIKQMRIMHSDALQSMNGIQVFTRLVEINLSSNSITNIQGLEQMTQLRELNLSCNRLLQLQGLGSLLKLEKLLVSHNKINDISGMQAMSGSNYQLKVLDIRSNKIREVRQLSYLQDLVRLSELSLETGKNSNPLCSENKQLYYEGLTSMRNFTKILRIDGQTHDQIAETLRYMHRNENTFNAPTLIVKKNISAHPVSLKKPQQQQQHGRTDSQETGVLKSVNWHEGNNPAAVPRWQGQAGFGQTTAAQGQQQAAAAAAAAADQMEFLSMQQEMQMSVNEKKELLHRLEVSEKFYEQKHAKILEENKALQEDNQEKGQRIKVLTKEKTFLENQLSEIKNERMKMIGKVDKREEIVETLQLRITDLIKENGQYHRELAIKSDSLEKKTSEMKQLNADLQEMKGRLRENERSLSEFHAKALEQARATLLTNEEIRRKYETLIEENKSSLNENGVLRGRVQELLDVCREWEFKYEKKLTEMTHKQEQQLRQVHAEFNSQEAHMAAQYKTWEQSREEEFKNNVDFMEQEFKNVLLENYEKFRRLSAAFEEKAKAEQDARHLMKIAVAKNSEQTMIIEELQEALQKVRKEVVHILAEKDHAQKELESKKNIFHRDASALEEERDRLYHEKTALDKHFQDLEQAHQTEGLELERAKAKLKKYAGIEEELERCLQTLAAKNIMLDDQNNTIDDLKGQIEALRSASEDLQKLQKKYDKQNQIIEELELQIQSTNEDLENANEETKAALRDLDKRKAIITTFESEFNDYRARQEQEDAQRQGKVDDLVGLLEECKQNIRRKEERIVELTNEIKQRSEAREADNLNHVNELKQKDRAQRDLQIKYEELKQDLQEVIIKNDLQKRQQKEAFTKFQQSLN